MEVRITPAQAGGKDKAEHLVQDHIGIAPRTGGEKMLPLRKHKVKLGSPPRGRGKGKDYATAETMQGITPAQAGEKIRQSIWYRTT